MSGKAKTTHCFTWKDKPVTGSILAGILGFSNGTMYKYANLCKSDRGEDIKAASEVQRKEQERKMIEWEGELTLIGDIAEEMGIKKATLLNRLNRYGVDCCYTYMPGTMPQYSKNGDGGGNDEWAKLGHEIRPLNSRQIKRETGTWEACQ